jgi:23S rRNA (adenine2503-C2)-methyltransferase
MRIIANVGREDIAVVYLGETNNGKLIECVEAMQPPHSRREKWILLVSTMFGCPVQCLMCDAGGFYQGKLSADEIFAQIDFLIRKRFEDGRVPSRQFKIQFARMGEPALNSAVMTVLEELPVRYHAPGLMPSISTIAPRSSQAFFERLLQIKETKYSGGNFQFQFSIHTTDPDLRDQIIPIKKWDFQEMAAYGEHFYRPGDRKITLNFALAQGTPLEAGILREYFDPHKFLIKITPLNPTYRASENRLSTYIERSKKQRDYQIVDALRQAGYQVIVSIGEVEENHIGSNCGQYVSRHLAARQRLADGYTYQVEGERLDVL